MSRVKTLIAKRVAEILIRCKCGLWKTLQLVNIEVTIETNHGRPSQSNAHAHAHACPPEEVDYIYISPHCHTQNDSCIKVGNGESHFNVSLIVTDKVTRQVSTDHNF